MPKGFKVLISNYCVVSSMLHCILLQNKSCLVENLECYYVYCIGMPQDPTANISMALSNQAKNTSKHVHKCHQ